MDENYDSSEDSNDYDTWNYLKKKNGTWYGQEYDYAELHMSKENSTLKVSFCNRISS